MTVPLAVLDDAIKYAVAKGLSEKLERRAKDAKTPPQKLEFLGTYGREVLYDEDFGDADIRRLARSYGVIRRHLPIVEGWGNYVVETALPRVVHRCPVLKEVWGGHGQKIINHMKQLRDNKGIYVGRFTSGGSDSVCIDEQFLEHPLRIVQFTLGHETGHSIDFTLHPNAQLQQALRPTFSHDNRHEKEFVADSIAALLLHAGSMDWEYILQGAIGVCADEPETAEHPAGAARIKNVRATLVRISKPAAS